VAPTPSARSSTSDIAGDAAVSPSRVIPGHSSGRIRLVVATATEASVAGVLPPPDVDLVVSGGTQLSEPPLGQVRHVVRTSPDLAGRLAGDLVAAGRADAVLAPAGPHLLAAALDFALGHQRGTPGPLVAALFDRSDRPPLLLCDVSARPAAGSVQSALARVTSDALRIPGRVVALAEPGEFGRAYADPEVAAVTTAAAVAPWVLDGWLAAGGRTPTFVVLGLPVVAVVGPLDVAMALACDVVRADLVGWSAKALAQVVAERRHEAGFDR